MSNRRRPATAAAYRIPSHEPSAWLRAAVRARLDRLDELGVLDTAGALGAELVTQLCGSVEPGSRDDRTCDRCGRYVRPGRRFFPATHTARPGVALVFGLCTDCARLEYGPDTLARIMAAS